MPADANEAALPAAASGRGRLRQAWPGAGHIERPVDVATVLAAVRDAASVRASTSGALALVERATEVAPAHAADPRHALAVPRELVPVLGAGLRRGSVVAVAGSGSLLLSMIGAAQAAGAWVAIVGNGHFGATAAVEHAIELDRLALVPEPGADWATIAAALIDGLDLVVLHLAAAVPAGLAERLRARARARGCVLIVAGPDRGEQVWPGPDLLLEATGHTWRGLGDGRGRLRGHAVQVRVSARRAAARPALWVEMPPPSLVALVGPQPGHVPDLGLPADWPASRPAPGPSRAALRAVTDTPAVADPWAAHLVTDAEWASRQSRTA